MSLSRSFFLTIATAATTLGFLTLGTAEAASATVSSTPTTQGTTDRDGYDASEWGALAPQLLSPSGCIQYADHPHYSTTTPNRVNAKVRAECVLTVPKMQHSAQLWETRWWGWDRIGIDQPYSRLWSKFGRAMANDWCRNNTVRVTGYGYVNDRDGRTYYAATVSGSVKNPCGL
jgi:hypothetical protein